MLLLNIETPLTFNNDIDVLFLLNIVIPDTYEDDNNVVLLLNPPELHLSVGQKE